jgi:hypothetical protein
MLTSNAPAALNERIKRWKAEVCRSKPEDRWSTIFAALVSANFPALVLDLMKENEIIKSSCFERTIIRYFEEISWKELGISLHIF